VGYTPKGENEMKYLLAILILWSVPTFAQEIERPKPQTVKVNLVSDITHEHVSYNLPVPHRTADKAWWIATGLSQAATIADVEATQRICLSSPSCSLANPLDGGRRPSRVVQYGITEGIWGLATWYSYRVKRHDDAAVAFGAKVDKLSHWYYLPIVVTASRSVGIITAGFAR
jgi:hypothetical protein